MNWRERRSAAGLDEGMTLIEVLVALLMLSVVSISAAVIFVGTLRTTTEQSATQRSIAVATRGLEAVQAVPVSQLLVGRSQTEVNALVTSAGMAPLLTQDIVSSDNFDGAVSAGATPVIPLTRTEVLDGVTYTVQTAINACWLSKGTQNCTRNTTLDATKVLRTTVRVTRSNCTRRCSYSTSELLDQQGDPIFKLAQSVPIITSVSPSSVPPGSTQSITLTGGAFDLGAVLALPASGGSLSNVVRVDGTKVTATWTAGTATGNYTLTLTNPDGGLATYSLSVSAAASPSPSPSPSSVPAPVAMNDCSTYSFQYYGSTYYSSNVRANDTPANTGSVVVVNPASNVYVLDANNQVVANGSSSAITVVVGSSATQGSQSVSYQVNVNGVASNTATVTFKFSGGC